MGMLKKFKKGLGDKVKSLGDKVGTNLNVVSTGAQKTLTQTLAVPQNVLNTALGVVSSPQGQQMLMGAGGMALGLPPQSMMGMMGGMGGQQMQGGYNGQVNSGFNPGYSPYSSPPGLGNYGFAGFGQNPQPMMGGMGGFGGFGGFGQMPQMPQGFGQNFGFFR